MLCFLLTGNAIAAEHKFSKLEHREFSELQQYMEEESWTKARQQLASMQKLFSKPYVQALIEHYLGQIALQMDEYKRATVHLEKAFAFNELPEHQQTGLIRTLGQLYCMDEKWKPCLQKLNSWIETTTDQVKADDYLLISNAYSQLENWPKVIPNIKQAIALRERPPENWYQLLISSHIQLKQWKQAIQQQKILVQYYGTRASHWRQLVSLHLQVDDNQSALACQRVAYEQKILNSSKDYRLLAQLMMHGGIPYFAAEIIQQGMDRGIVKRDKKNLELLSVGWIQAEETDKAITSLAQLIKLDRRENYLTQLAQMQIKQMQWKAAQTTLLSALKQPVKESSQLQLMLGITRINLRDYGTARESLMVASKNKKLKKLALNWIQYLEQVDPDFERNS